MARFEPCSFSQLPGWNGDDHGAALACFRQSAIRMAQKPYTTKQLGIDAAGLAGLAPTALGCPPQNARAFFEENFQPEKLVPDSGAGFVTAYYEPELSASPVQTPRFSYPLYARPHDLAEIDDFTRPAGIDASFRFARKTPHGFEEYLDRPAIEAGALAGKGLELAWIESPVDGFFVHIQGSARLNMTNGEVWRISYDGKSGHPFTPIGAWLIENGHLRREDVTMQAIRLWLDADAARARQLMNRNRSFIFFQRTTQDDASLGPVAAASVPLSAGRSLAVDHQLHTFGTPVFIVAHQAIAGLGKDFRCLMVAQDTGTAIVGPCRGDLFIGSGMAAGDIAGAVRHAADFYVLRPKTRVNS